MWSAFEFISRLQYKVKALAAEVAAFKSGEKYAQMEEAHRKDNAYNARIIKELKRELADAHKETITVRNIWIGVVEEYEKENSALKEKVLQMEEALRQEKAEKYQALVAQAEAEERNRKLIAQLNRDFQNSSKPSSMNPNHKKISNNREKTDRRPGGQPGHEGHARKRRDPDTIISIPPSEKFLDTRKYRPTGKTVRKQQVGIKVSVVTVEYETPEYLEIATGKTVHAPFPEGVADNVNYDGSVRALAFLLNQECNVSIDKVSRFISDITGGELRLSKGMISNLSKEFSKKTEVERKKMFNHLLASPVMHIDATNARMNGASRQVFVCTDPEGTYTLYFAREHKGHAGVKDTPAELFNGIMVHDHDKTFYSYGEDHQECLEHVLRYLLDSIQNEPERTWNKQMRKLIQEMIHCRNQAPPDSLPEEEVVREFEARYDAILEKAQEEYEDVPAGKYYMDGYNLFIRLRDYKHNHLLFLHNPLVPTTNNISERLLRGFKRKQKQAMSFRSDDGIVYFCDSLSMLNSLRAKSDNMFENLKSLFESSSPVPG